MQQHGAGQLVLQEAAPVPLPATTPARRRAWHRAARSAACMRACSPPSPHSSCRPPTRTRPAVCMHSTPAGFTFAAPGHMHNEHSLAQNIDGQQVALYRSVKSLQLSGREDEALQLLQAGLASFPADRHMLALASSLMVKTGRLNQAAALLSSAQALHPQHVPFHTAAALLCAKRGQHAAAVAVLQEGLQRNPDNAVLLQTWAKIEAASGHPEPARSLFEQAIHLRPGMPHSYAAWASLELAQGNVQRARELFEQGSQAVPRHAPLLHAWARMEQGLGCASTAKQLCERALKADPAHIPSYMLLGQLEWSQGNPNRARDIWKRGSNNPAGASAALLCFWAQREARIHNYRAARGLLQAALAAEPKHTRARVLLAMLHDRAGQTQAAAELYMQLLQGQQSIALDGHSTNSNGHSSNSNGHGTSSNGHSTAGAYQPASVHTHVLSFGGASTHVSHTTATQQLSVSYDSQPSGVVHTMQQDGMLAAPAQRLPAALTAGVDDSTPIPVLYACCQHLRRQQRHQLQQHNQQQYQQAMDQLMSLMAAKAPCNGFLCHLQGLTAQQEGKFADATAWFQKGTQASVSDGSLLCWEGLAELLAFLGKHDLARRAWRTGAARAARPAGWDAGPSLEAAATHVSPSLASDTTTHTGTSSVQPANNGMLASQAGLSPMAAASMTSPSAGTSARPDSSASPLNSAGHASDTGTMQVPSSGKVYGEVDVGSSEHHGSVAVSAAGLYARPNLPSQTSSSAAAQQADFNGADPLTASAGVVSPGVALADWMLVGVTSRYLRQWALFEKKAGGSVAAAQLFQAAANKDPQDYKTWLAWATFERRRGQLQHAEQLFRQGLHVAPYNTHMWYAYANMLWRQRGDVNCARDTLRLATKHCPRSVQLRLEWALLEWRGAGDPEAAEKLLLEAFNLPGGQQHGPLQEAWAQLQKELGRPASPSWHSPALQGDALAADGNLPVHGVGVFSRGRQAQTVHAGA